MSDMQQSNAADHILDVKNIKGMLKKKKKNIWGSDEKDTSKRLDETTTYIQIQPCSEDSSYKCNCKE